MHHPLDVHLQQPAGLRALTQDSSVQCIHARIKACMTQNLAVHCTRAYTSATVPSSSLGVQGKGSFDKVVFYKQAHSQHMTAGFHLQSVHCTVYVCNKTLRRQRSQGTDSKAQYFTRGQMAPLPQVVLTVQKQQPSSSAYKAELGQFTVEFHALRPGSRSSRRPPARTRSGCCWQVLLQVPGLWQLP